MTSDEATSAGSADDDTPMANENPGTASDPGASSEGDSDALWIRHGRHRAPEYAAGQRLDRYLSERFPYRSRTQWVRIIKSGLLRVDGSVPRAGRVVRAGERIEYDAEPMVEPSVDPNFRVLHEDDHLIAVNKPGDLPVHPSGRYFHNTLLSILLRQRGQTLDAPGFRIVHRLDRETSGVLVFGKTRQATGFLARQFQGRDARKEYLLLVEGRPSESEFEVDAPLGPHPDSKIRKAVGVNPDSAESKPAFTRFRVEATGPQHSLLRAFPKTGRLHQIRVHAKHAGYPIVGDKMYGLNEEFFLKFIEGRALSAEEEAMLRHGRQALHAARLTLRHPESDREVTFRASLAPDLVGLASDLGIDLPTDKDAT